MKKIILPSLILVLLSSAPLFFINEEQTQPPDYITWPLTILTFICYLFFLRREKLIYNEGTSSFGSLFKHGLQITLLYSVIATIVHFIHFKLVAESTHQKIINSVMEKIHNQQLDNTGYVSASSEKRMATMMSIISNPYVMSAFKLFWFIAVGLFYSLIGAGIFKSKSENTFDS